MSSQLLFVPFNSALDGGFWHKLSQLKLDVYGLDDKTKPIRGFYVNNDPNGMPSRMNIAYTAFDETANTPPRCLPSHGILKNTNTLEEFKACDKMALLQESASQIWEAITTGRAIDYPSLLACFLMLTFSDLKKYQYYYWFAFPTLKAPKSVTLVSPAKKISDCFLEEEMICLVKSYDSVCLPKNLGFFIVIKDGLSHRVGELNELAEAVKNKFTVMLGFCDPSTQEDYPGWPLRNLLSLASYHWADILPQVQILCFRDRVKDGTRDFSHSILLEVKLDSLKNLTGCPTGVGWEATKGQLRPRKVDLSSSMDPKRLAESAVDLNLKLMRWRLLPELELQKVADSRCLLLGSGTLGCNIARCLLGWGVRTITLLDNGRISYSNPVRQSLFEFEDSLNGGKPKAETAAESLKKIFPGVNAQGISLSIPMPGHAISEGAIQQTKEDVQKLEELIESHDVVFLLMDTRESRWLPTLIAAAKSKIVINAALGFDTFLVVRHGVRQPGRFPSEEEINSLPLNAPIPGNMLGCYFCNDVVAPGDSTRDRTLDQQCTVSRPGMSMITGALAVELLVSVLQHPHGTDAPADTSSRDEHLSKDSECPLGLVPHQIRGFLSRFHQVLPASRAYNRCTACSQVVCENYLKDGFDFLLKVFNEPSYVEELTGLTQLHADTQTAEILELSDDDDLECI